MEKSNPKKWKVINKESAHKIQKMKKNKNHNTQSNKIRTEHKLLRNSTQSELNINNSVSETNACKQRVRKPNKNRILEERDYQ